MTKLEEKIVKAHCRKTGQQMGLSVAKFGSSWEVVNMVFLDDDQAGMISSQVTQSNYYVHNNLLPCPNCGSRKVAGCSCAQKIGQCKKGMPYRYPCVYCKELEIDKPSRKPRISYSKWASISNIPGALPDKFGNPEGSQYDLGLDGSFVGYKILIVNYCSIASFSCVPAALKKKGFTVKVYTGDISVLDLRRELTDACQLWIISQQGVRITPIHYMLIKGFFEKGHGLYIWGDNDPLNDTANYIIGRLFNSQLSGDYYARKVLGIQNGQGMPGIIPNHLISTGLVSFFEGDTIAKIKMSKDIQPLAYSSDRNIVTAYYDKDGKRALIDGAFTRLWDWDWGQTAGTERYIVNAAVWLVNLERFG